jgi:integrase
MSRRSSVPKLRRHRASGQGLVRLSGRDHYLGRWPDGLPEPPPEVLSAYGKKIAEWLSAGRKSLPTTIGQAGPGAAAAPTVGEIILPFFDHVEQYYRHPDGRPTSEVSIFRRVLRRLRRMYGPTPAGAFDNLELERFRDSLVQAGLARKRINKDIIRVRALFRWAAAKKLIPASVHQTLSLVTGLKAGRTAARETDPVTPVPDELVTAVLPYLPRQVRAMVDLQRATGMRPGEVCSIRTADLDTSGAVWLYRPRRHKNSYRGKPRVIAIGPKGQAVLQGWLRLNLEEPIFQPREVESARAVARRAKRVTPMTPSQARRRPKVRRKRAPGAAYTANSYGHAVRTACRKAGVPVWSPNRLRHSFATEVRKQFGLEAAQVALGHSDAVVTQIYAERDLTLAVRVAAEVG